MPKGKLTLASNGVWALAFHPQEPVLITASEDHTLKLWNLQKTVLIKEREPGVKTFAGDCQQNQAMPKIPDQSSYFSRQLNYYNFTMAEAVGKSDMNHFGYTWTEDQSRKGSNQIASAMCHRLMNSNYDGIYKVRLFADGCGGQNKNVQVLCMASWWLLNKAPKSVKTVQLVYPVTGHSYLPPDRVFGRIEKDIRKEEEILSPAEYKQIIDRHETVLELGKDWKVRDWKKYTTQRFKSAASFPFKISQTKIFEIRKTSGGLKTVEIKAEENYRHADSRFGRTCKPGMNIISTPELLREKVLLSQDKLNDIKSLLNNRFGENWQNQKKLKYFFQFFKNGGKKSAKVTGENLTIIDEEEEECTCCEEDETTFLQ